MSLDRVMNGVAPGAYLATVAGRAGGDGEEACERLGEPHRARYAGYHGCDCSRCPYRPPFLL